ncbi:hypothetical protein Bbelb_393270 [Branchiostoma belcheri]|nr:hypothetical protein Bbelb_393270 [Branchiostoma belcheri]
MKSPANALGYTAPALTQPDTTAPERAADTICDASQPAKHHEAQTQNLGQTGGQEYPNLGFILDKDLTSSEQVHSMVTKVSRRLHYLRLLTKQGMGVSDLTKVYLALIRPVLEYANNRSWLLRESNGELNGSSLWVEDGRYPTFLHSENDETWQP